MALRNFLHPTRIFPSIFPSKGFQTVTCTAHHIQNKEDNDEQPLLACFE